MQVNIYGNEVIQDKPPIDVFLNQALKHFKDSNQVTVCQKKQLLKHLECAKDSFEMIKDSCGEGLYSLSYVMKKTLSKSKVGEENLDQKILRVFQELMYMLGHKNKQKVQQQKNEIEVREQVQFAPYLRTQNIQNIGHALPKILVKIYDSIKYLTRDQENLIKVISSILRGKCQIKVILMGIRFKQGRYIPRGYNLTSLKKRKIQSKFIELLFYLDAEIDPIKPYVRYNFVPVEEYEDFDATRGHRYVIRIIVTPCQSWNEAMGIMAP